MEFNYDFCSRPLQAGAEREAMRFIVNMTAVHCGKEFHGRSGRKYCSHRCYIAERFGGKDDSENVTA